MKQIGFVMLSLTALSAVALGGTTAVTPEPASIGMIAAGIGGLAFIAWRRRGAGK